MSDPTTLIAEADRLLALRTSGSDWTIAAIEKMICDAIRWNGGAGVVSDAVKEDAAFIASAHAMADCIQALRGALVAQPQPGEWRPIALHTGHGPVIAATTPDKDYNQPTTAFVDVTGIWRVFRSEGGMTPLPFAPTHFMPLPPLPKPTDEQKEEGT